MKNAKEIGRDFLHFLMPKNSFGDYLFSLCSFVKANEYYPNTKHPRRFMEHLLHMKRYGEFYDPLRQFTSDKYCVKQFVASTLGPQYSARTYAVLRTKEEVESLRLRTFPCVIKPTHASGYVLFVEDEGDVIDRNEIAGWLKLDLYRAYREANYRYLKPGIIVEEMISDGNGSTPNDYKIYCIDGRPQFIQVDKDRFGNHVRNYYNTNWDHLPFTVEDRPIGPVEGRPKALDEMLQIARALAAYFPRYVRVDLFCSGSGIKVAELTHCSANCKMRPRPIEYDTLIGELFRNPAMRLEPIQARGIPGEIEAGYPEGEVYPPRRMHAAP